MTSKSICLLGLITPSSGREGRLADLKVQANMLTVVLVINGLPGSVPASRELVEQICYTVGQKTRESGDVGTTAVQCSRALLAAALKADAPPSLQAALPQLLTELVRYVAQVAEEGDRISREDARFAGLQEILRAFASFAAGVADNKSENQSDDLDDLV